MISNRVENAQCQSNRVGICSVFFQNKKLKNKKKYTACCFLRLALASSCVFALYFFLSCVLCLKICDVYVCGICFSQQRYKNWNGSGEGQPRQGGFATACEDRGNSQCQIQNPNPTVKLSECECQYVLVGCSLCHWNCHSY